MKGSTRLRLYVKEIVLLKMNSETDDESGQELGENGRIYHLDCRQEVQICTANILCQRVGLNQI